MQKFLIFLLVTVFFSCNDEISNNIPAFQAKVNAYYPWNPLEYSATKYGQSLSITGFNLNGRINLYIEDISNVENCFNSNSDSYAYYQSTLSYVNERFRDTIKYSSTNDGQAIGAISEFCISIDEFDLSNNFLTGEFFFDAHNYSGEFDINISQGIFYKIPIISSNQD